MQSSGTPRTITSKNIDLIKKEEKCTKSEEKKVIDISSSTDTFDDLTSISESTTEDSSGIFTIETRSSSNEDSSTPSVYKRKNLNERIREQAYSAKCATDSIKKIKKVKEMKTPSEEPEENQDFLKEQEKLYRHQIHHNSNQHIQEQFKNLNKNNQDTLRQVNYAADRMRDAHQDITKLKNHTQEIKQSLPSWNSILFPVSTQEIFHHLTSLTNQDTIDWSPFGLERKRELKRIEKSIFFHQMKANGYEHAWKDIYTKVNLQCNALGIPYKNRIKLYQKEMEFLSLLLHDVMPKNYAKQGIFPNDVTVSSYQLFFSPEDSINIARKKWYDYLGNDYKFFWDVYSNIIHITTLSIYDITKLNDIKEIIWFINPIGMQYLVQTPKIYDKMMFVHQQACSLENWVHSRHK